MSGIAGIFYRNGRPVEQETIDRMVGAMKHRGPDGIHTWREGSIALGHCMMHTTPEAVYDNLPMESPEGNLVLTADARIDNREELIRVLRLKPYRDAPLTDCDLILAAYKKWGEACPNHLLGAFAFAIWDKREQRLFCARDHFGVKPLVYYCSGQVFLFSSYIKSFLGLGFVDLRLDKRQFCSMLMSQRPKGDTTIYKYVKKVGHASVISAYKNNLKLRRYWYLEAKKLRESSYQDYVEEFLDIFKNSVRCRLRSENEYGVELSGGLDSTSIAGIANHISDIKPIAISQSFPSYDKSNEYFFINSAVKNLDIKNILINAENYDIFKYIREAVSFTGDPAYISGNFHLVMQRSKCASNNNLSVLLCGYDGDTVVWHGYERIIDLLENSRVNKLNKLLDEFIKVRVSRSNRTLRQEHGVWSQYIKCNYFYKNIRKNKLNTILNMLRLDIIRSREIVSWIKELVKSDIVENRDDVFNMRELIQDGLRSHCGTHPAKSQRKTLSMREKHLQHFYEGDRQAVVLEALDAYGSINQVEYRVPFMDRRLVEYCVSLPPACSFSLGQTRRILRDAMKGYVPDTILDRVDKGNLAPSTRQRVYSPGYEALTHSIFQGPGMSALLRKDKVRTYVQHMVETNSSSVWLISALALSAWMQYISDSTD